MNGFIKARYRRIGKIQPRDIVDIDGISPSTTFGISIGSAYALRDALSDAIDDYEKPIDEINQKQYDEQQEQAP